MSSNTLPIALGAQSSSAAFNGLLGRVYVDGATDISYMLVKAAGTLLVNQTVALQFTLGVPNGQVNTTTTRNDPAAAGVVPVAYTAGITSGNVFLLQISGSPLVIPADSLITNTAAQRALGTATVAGAVQLANSGTVTAGGFDATGNIGYATNSTGASAALSTTTIRCVLQGLVGRFNGG